jgi:hypothetical protein
MSPNNRSPSLDSRVCFLLFVCSFYKLTNCTFTFVAFILLVMAGADVAQPIPTSICYPSSLSKQNVRGLNLGLGDQGGVLGDL